MDDYKFYAILGVIIVAIPAVWYTLIHTTIASKQKSKSIQYQHKILNVASSYATSSISSQIAIQLFLVPAQNKNSASSFIFCLKCSFYIFTCSEVVAVNSPAVEEEFIIVDSEASMPTYLGHME